MGQDEDVNQLVFSLEDIELGAKCERVSWHYEGFFQFASSWIEDVDTHKKKTWLWRLEFKL